MDERLVALVREPAWIARCVGGPLDGRLYPAEHLPTTVGLDDMGSYVLKNTSDIVGVYSWRRSARF